MSKTRRSRDHDGLYQRKDSSYWWMSFIDASGKRARRSTGTTDRKEAEAILSKCRLDAFRGSTWGEETAPSFDEMLLRYLRSRDISSSVRSAARHLAGELGGTSSVASVQDVRQFIRTQQKANRAPGTINKQLVLWSAAINEYNIEEGTQIPNPIRGQKLREPEGRVRWITKQEAKSLIDAAGQQTDHLVAAIELALCTGMRRSELLGLEWSHIDLQAGLIHLQAENTKTNRGRTVPMNENVKRVIRERLQYRARYCPGSKWIICNQNGNRFADLRRSFKTALKVAGIDNFRWHDMRHTFAAWLVTAGVRLPEVRDLLGHSSVRMTERYAHLAPENLRDAVAQLPELSHDLVTLDTPLHVV